MNLLIDGNNLLFRTFWIHKTHQNGEENENMLTYMFLRNLKSYADKFSPSDIYVCWDKRLVSGATNFRYISAPDYKGDRDTESFEGVYDQMDQIVQMTQYLGIHNMYPRIMEADDVITWLCDNLEGDNIIITNDHDLWQLVSPTVSVFVPNKKEVVNVENFIKFSKVPLEWFVQFKALVGDKSDNITGLHRVGEKTAVKLLENWDIAYANLSDSDQQLYQRNLQLVDLSKGYSTYPEESECYQEQLDSIRSNDLIDFKKFIELCNVLDYSSIIDKKSDWFRVFIESKRLQKLFG